MGLIVRNKFNEMNWIYAIITINAETDVQLLNAAGVLRALTNSPNGSERRFDSSVNNSTHYILYESNSCDDKGRAKDGSTQSEEMSTQHRTITDRQ